ncbi:scarecrow-like protein 30 isoform X2 [Rhodamnia argentea]|uniref:Scarecrow-like protein 30 isoform X2 n=1 Tax=Rhodamnia argentea TaxID=178133 RepID=A0A8B8PRM2_9MYRT|nr:scarecrow-like protein 30 isoform X2 [Rhodamnia argentea]
MESLLTEYCSSLSGLKFDHGSISIHPNRIINGFNHDAEPNTPISNASLVSGSLEVESPEDSDTSNSLLKFISEILMEEDLEEKNCMLQDCLAALQAEEKNWRDVLYQKDTPSSDHSSPSVNQIFTSGYDHYSPDNSNSDGCYNCAIVSNHVKFNGVREQGNCNVPRAAVVDYLDSCSGIQAANELLLSRTTDILGVGSNRTMFPEPKEVIDHAGSEGEGSQCSPDREKKSHGREDGEYQQGGRSNKQSAIFVEEEFDEQAALFDKVLLCQSGRDDQLCPLFDNPEKREDEELQRNVASKGSSSSSSISSGSNGSGKTARRRKKGGEGDMVDLWTLLTQCAQSVASNDHRSSHELLKQIRQHSSAFGDGTQRLAYYFANGLEARLIGTEMPSYSMLIGNGASAAEILNAYQVYVQACPFKRMSNFFANRTILKRAEEAQRLHIIDFGILYGFQWPCLIQRISRRQGGPPKIRMTGIEFPQPGFRPSERVEETGRRLEKYAKRFNVDFEYHVIAKKWETIELADLKLEGDEMTVVNCLYRLKNLADESVSMNSPRDAVLNLIRRINPDIFVHGVVNGSYNAPFFVTRFREALFHFSSLFDMFDVNLPQEDPQRILFEKEVFARDAMNAVACEGFARVERPETYKQWQVRNMRAGFRQIPLDDEIFRKVKKTVKAQYHKDFIIDHDGYCMLQGWKGRVIHALSCWVPA